MNFFPNIDKKTVIKSALLLFLTLGTIFTIDLTIHIKSSSRIFFYLAPFLLQLIISLFVKKKESWMMGAIGSGLLSLILFVVGILVFLQ